MTYKLNFFVYEKKKFKSLHKNNFKFRYEKNYYVKKKQEKERNPIKLSSFTAFTLKANHQCMKSSQVAQ